MFLTPITQSTPFHSKSTHFTRFWLSLAYLVPSPPSVIWSIMPANYADPHIHPASYTHTVIAPKFKPSIVPVLKIIIAK